MPDLDGFLKEMSDAGIAVLHKRSSLHLKKIEAIPTSLCSFDLATGVGGLPRGRICEFFGKEHSGKTMLALLATASVQRRGGQAAFIDAEHTFTAKFAKLLGVNYDDLAIAKPSDLEQAFDALKKMLQSHLFDIITLDSIAGIASKLEIEQDASEGTSRAATAQILSRELKKVASLVEASNAVVVLINQIRESPNATPGKMKTEYTPGGRAIRHHATLRVDIRIKEPYLESKRQVGHRGRIKIIKNKVSEPFTEAEFDLYYRTGIDRLTDLIETAVNSGVVERQSSFYVFGDKKWHGQDGLRAALDSDHKLADRMYRAVMASLENLGGRSKGQPESPSSSDTDS